MNHILTAGGIHMVLNKKPVAIAKTDSVFAQVVNAIKNKASEEDILEILEAERRRLEEATKVTEHISLKEGALYFKGEPIHGVLCERMLQMLEEGFDLAPMQNFLERLERNPSHRVVQHLYAFLEFGKNPITEDGCFLAYKAVRGDFMDIHSGTFSNKVGDVLVMPRNKVDEDPNRTCSSGFHVCSFSYLPFFSHANGHVMVCKVDPEHVVAIPADYNNTKMRVCQYEVIGEYEGYYEEQRDVLTNTSVATDEDDVFEVRAERGENGDFDTEGYYPTLLAAAQAAEDALNDSSISKVEVFNLVTSQVVSSQVNPDYEDDSTVEDDESFSIVAYDDNNVRVVLSEGYDSVSQALERAIEIDEFSKIEILSSTGEIVRTLT